MFLNDDAKTAHTTTPRQHSASSDTFWTSVTQEKKRKKCKNTQKKP